MLFDESKFSTKKELFSFLKKNKETLIRMKKEQYKKGESCMFLGTHNNKSNNDISYKANTPINNPGDEIRVEAVINSSNWLDSHQDVHIPGLWKKSIQENRFIKHLQEHDMAFDKIISDKTDLKVSTKRISWIELGQSYEGVSECLVFDSIVRRSRNEFMFLQYANGHVDNHSVGMRYVKLIMCINDESAGAEFEAWEKYYNQIINPEMADKKGYFWVVTEAKIIEGSAVPIGSNIVTPTRNNNKTEPLDYTQESEPTNVTQINYNRIINNLNF